MRWITRENVKVDRVACPWHRSKPGSFSRHVFLALAGKNGAAGEVNPATQQIDFYIRSPQQNPKNRPAREVFTHFFGMEVTWK